MKLFTPGPVQVKQSILDAASQPIYFHRAKGFEELYKQCTVLLRNVFKSPNEHSILILNGSGTYANEVIIHSVIDSNDKVLVLSNGDFGDRLEKILKLHKKNHSTYKKLHGEIFEIEDIEEQIQNYQPTVVMAVALETSTGIVNPIRQIGELKKKYNFRFFVDAVSALGAENINLERDNIDACTSVPNKALESLPGISFVSIDTKWIESSQQVVKTSLYLDLHKYYDSSTKNQTPTTPAVNIYMALKKALEEFDKEGLENRMRRYRILSEIVRNEIKGLRFKILNYEKAREFAANAISCMKLPANINARELHNYLYSKGCTLWFYDHKEIEFQDNVMQVSVMGDLSETDIKQLFQYIREFINEVK